MGLGSNTPLHRDISRIHSTSHCSLGREIIGCNALRVHSLHPNHRHRPWNRPIGHYMTSCHAPRNCISRRYLCHPNQNMSLCASLNIVIATSNAQMWMFTLDIGNFQVPTLCSYPIVKTSIFTVESWLQIPQRVQKLNSQYIYIHI